MALLPTLVILAVVAFCQADVAINEDIVTFQRAVVNENTATFQRKDNSLPWPLLDYKNPGPMMLHGSHCYELINEKVNKTNQLNVAHHLHCRSSVSNILRLFEKNPTYQVPDWICDIVKEASSIHFLGWLAIFNNEGQNHDFNELVTVNYHVVLFKTWLNPEALTEAERSYIAQFESESVSKMGAVGLYCRVNGDIEGARKTFNALSEI